MENISLTCYRTSLMDPNFNYILPLLEEKMLPQKLYMLTYVHTSSILNIFVDFKNEYHDISMCIHILK